MEWWNKIVEWTGTMEWNGNKLENFDGFSPPYIMTTSEQRPPVNKEHLNLMMK